MRSDLLPIEKLSVQIDALTQFDFESVYAKYVSKREQLEDGVEPNFLSLVDTVCLNVLQCVPIAYTRGDSLDSIDKQYMQPAIHRLLIAREELQKYGVTSLASIFPCSETTYFGSGPHMGVKEMLSVLTLYSWMLCFGTSNEDIKKLSEVVTHEGLSISVDTVIKHFLPERKVRDNNTEKNPIFDRWASMYTTSGDQQIEIIVDYLDNWAKYMSESRKEGVVSLSLVLKHKHKTNKTFAKELTGTWPVFYGFWAWEVVLAVKLFNIDDSSFRDHELYPVEAVDYLKLP